MGLDKTNHPEPCALSLEPLCYAALTKAEAQCIRLGEIRVWNVYSLILLEFLDVGIKIKGLRVHECILI